MGDRFAEVLAGARKAKRITLRKLGQLVDLAPSFLSELENERKMPPKDEGKIENLEIVLGLVPGELLRLARIERQAKKSTFIERLFGIDEEAALGLCRATEETDNDGEFLEVLEETLRKLRRQTDG